MMMMMMTMMVNLLERATTANTAITTRTTYEWSRDAAVNKVRLSVCLFVRPSVCPLVLLLNIEEFNAVASLLDRCLPNFQQV